ncbi:Protein-tyrosine phosphatase-like protein [Rhypophila sp. PSN 637]
METDQAQIHRENQISPVLPTQANKMEDPAAATESKKPIEDIPSICKILPNLYVGTAAASINIETLRANKISAIVSITTVFQPEWESPKITAMVPLARHLLVPADDNPAIDLLGHFDYICDWIDEQRAGPPSAGSGVSKDGDKKSGNEGLGDDGKNNVLVHCQGGVSRSPTICMAYLLRNKYPDATKAPKNLKDELLKEFWDNKDWGRTWPQANFWEQLKVWVATGYNLWHEDGAFKKEYMTYFREVWSPALDEMNEECPNLGWKGDELGLTVVGVRGEACDVRKATWEESKNIMLGIRRGDIWFKRERASWFEA